jgi:uncharacterized peroxidase-related enzyme
MARVAYLEPQEATGEAKEFLNSLAQKSTKLNTITKALAYRPALLKAMGALGQAVGGESTIPRRVKELVILKVSRINGCKYCVAAHTRSAKKIGLSDQEIRALPEYYSAKAFSEKEKIALEYAEAVTKKVGNFSDELFSRVKEHFDDGEIVELTGLIAYFNFMNRLLDALQVDIDFQ